MAALGRVIVEDPHELEDLQMILSLEFDLDNEVLEDAMFREAKPFEVKETGTSGNGGGRKFLSSANGLEVDM